MSNVHILPDENLGGVLREYVEVDREANNGDLLKIKGSNVIRVAETVCHFGVYYERDEGGDNYVLHHEYRVLEPTDIVHIDSTRYRLVDRKAKVGEKVMNRYTGKVSDVINIHVTAVGIEPIEDDEGKIYGFLHGAYYVLEPVEPAENELVTAEEGNEKSILDLLANLARRMTELERKFENLESRQKRLMGRIVDTEEKIEMALDDIVTLDERTQPLVALVKAVKGDE